MGSPIAPQDLVEIAAGGAGSLPTEVMSEFYRRSIARPSIFVLNGVAPATVDNALDAAVAAMPLSIAGVRYVLLKDEGALREELRRARRVWAATSHFRTLATALGVPARSILALPKRISGLNRALQQEDEIMSIPLRLSPQATFADRLDPNMPQVLAQ